MQEDCSHDVLYQGLCAYCGKDVSKTHFTISGELNADTVTLDRRHPQLQVKRKEAERIEHEAAQRLLARRKLSLVLDLDNTLVHASIQAGTTNQDPNFQRGSPSDLSGRLVRDPFVEDLFEFSLPGSPQRYLVKLRPSLQAFLSAIHELFELHIYTMGTRAYACRIAEIIDPGHLYFHERIASREDCTDMNFKNLQRLFPCDDSMVLILDDREDVWQHCPNLIKIEPYIYMTGPGSEINNAAGPAFQRSQGPPQRGPFPAEGPGPPALLNNRPVRNHEDHHLPRILEILQKVHAKFFAEVDRFKLREKSPRNSENASRKHERRKISVDVKNVLQKVRAEILAGVHCVFSGIFPTNVPPQSTDIWRLAEAFGAVCQNELVHKVTHVIAAKAGTSKVSSAMKTPGIFVVHPDWLYCSVRHWRRADEFDFLLPDPALSIPNVRALGPKALSGLATFGHEWRNAMGLLHIGYVYAKAAQHERQTKHQHLPSSTSKSNGDITPVEAVPAFEPPDSGPGIVPYCSTRSLSPSQGSQGCRHGDAPSPSQASTSSDFTEEMSRMIEAELAEA